jgi:phage shock protein A
MAKKVDELEARAEASVELADLSQSSSLEKEFAKLESSGAGADLLLEELKQKMITEGSTGQA